MSHLPINVIILTFNSEKSLSKVIESCLPLTERFLIVDSFSSDHTLEIAKSYQCDFIQHKFENYSQQRNWAQEYANLGENDWVLHLDSDEVLSPQLVTSIQQEFQNKTPQAEGYLFKRLPHFLGKPIKHGHLHPNWHLRLFKNSKGKCEQRLYDQHFIVTGSTKHLRGWLLDLQLTTLEGWTATHNRWSTLEAQEIYHQLFHQPAASQLQASLWGDSRMQKRWLKNHIWYRLPLLIRPFLFFIYSYILKLGFLDGRVGLIYCVLQAFWFRFLVDAKIIEMHQQESLSNHE